MSEPDIATLARRLAEQNNVDWRALSGSGQDGKIVERDVLDYLARVMAGDEALDPTPEPLPDGMEAWPDQDAPAYFKPNGAGQPAQAEQAADAALETVDDLLADLPVEDAFDVAPAEEDTFADATAEVEDELPTDPAFAFGSEAAAGEPGYGADEAVFSESDVATTTPADDEELSDDIFLFDDDGEADFGSFSTDEPQEQPAWEAAEAPAWEPAAQAVDDVADDLDAGFGAAVDAAAASDDDSDDALLVADDDPADGLADSTEDVADDFIGDRFAGDVFGAELAGDAAQAGDIEAEVGFDLADAPSADVADDAEEAAGVFASSMESYDHDFTTPSEQFENDSDVGGWSGGDLSDLGADPGVTNATNEEGGALPDLWASEGQASENEPEAGEVGSGDLPTELAADFEQPGEADEEDDTSAFDFGDAEAADDVEDLEQAEALDEHDATLDLQELDAQPDTITPAAAFADLPLVRTGNVMRRHVDLSALAGAQLAAGLELGHDEPLSATPFLLRAVAKAAAELGQVKGQVALAELEDEVSYRRVDDAAGRAFGSLVQELAGPGSEEDELGLVAVDLSGFDMDEVLLDLSVPAVTLGRVLYDTQRGAHRSTLTLSGDLPLTEGARLLARVADLLEAPVRLLL